VTTRPTILVLGGGFAALETAFLLRMRLHDDARIRVVSDRDSFVFRPNSIYVPFGADPASLYVPLARPMARREIDLLLDRVEGVDPAAQRVGLGGGRHLGYDRLVIATGAGMRPEEVPGLAKRAATIWTPDSMLDVRSRFESVRAAAARGERSRVLFLVPPGNKCAGPLYEVVLMFETWLRRHGVRGAVEITWSTYEASYIQAFGPRLHDVVSAEYAERGIDGHTREVIAEIAAGEARYADGSVRAFDHLIAFPPYIAAVAYDGLPADERGFLRTVADTRQLEGYDDVYVPGDAGDFPIKQAFLAFLQADAVAEHIAADIRGRTFSQPFDPVSMCIMEMFDKATFAQVPVEITGDPDRPVRVRPDADGDYKVGTSPAWRLGKKALAFTVPMRFAAGEPFHAGAGWKLMDIGLHAMSGVMAR
jgi:sulfide:quinone oxidoreductase